MGGCADAKNGKRGWEVKCEGKSLSDGHHRDAPLPGRYVVVQFHPWFKFYFHLFWGMVMYDNEFKIKGNKI